MHNTMFTLPITNPTLIFLVVMIIVLLTPLVLSKLRIPHVVGMILAGILVGPFGLGLLDKDSSFDIFGKVGLYFIMLLAGLEMNMEGFRQHKNKALTHGLLTFIIPISIGFVFNLSLLNYSILSGLLLASMYASYTLITYPIVMRYGLSEERSVTIAVGATAITDTLTLLVLAIIAGTFKGEINTFFWCLLALKIALVLTIIILGFPRLVRTFFRHYENSVVQFVFVIALTFSAALMMELAGLEGLLGAFLTGIVINRYVPKVSRLMTNLEFVGNAVFIPYFLIGVGMMVNVALIFKGWQTLWVAGIMISCALGGKWLACFTTQKIFKLETLERNLIYGLSSAQAGATLAAVLVGYNIILPNGERLLGDNVLNGTIILILITCIFSSIITEHSATKILLKHHENPLKKAQEEEDDEQILIPMQYPETADGLMAISVMMRNKELNRGIVALNVVYDDHHTQHNMEKGRKLLQHAIAFGNQLGVRIETQARISNNVAAGIKHAFNEYQASEIVMGMHIHLELSPKFWGNFHQSLFSTLPRQIMMVRLKQPLNTIRRIQVAIPSRAQYETGFYRWLERISRIVSNLECRITFHGRNDTHSFIKKYIEDKHPRIRAEYTEMQHWEELPTLASTIAKDHLFIVVTARKGTISYKSALEHLPDELKNYFSGTNLIILFPEQGQEYFFD